VEDEEGRMRREKEGEEAEGDEEGEDYCEEGRDYEED
jgi:hypothetical protein